MKIVHQERGGVVSLILADVDGAFAEALDGGRPSGKCDMAFHVDAARRLTAELFHVPGLDGNDRIRVGEGLRVATGHAIESTGVLSGRRSRRFHTFDGRRGHPPDFLAAMDRAVAEAFAGATALREALGADRTSLFARLPAGRPGEIEWIHGIDDAEAARLASHVQKYPVLAEPLARAREAFRGSGTAEEFLRAAYPEVGISPALLRRLEGLDLDPGPQGMEVLSSLPVDWIPPKEDGPGRRDFVGAFPVVVLLATGLSSSVSGSRGLFEGCKGRWGPWIESVRKACGLPPGGGLDGVRAAVGNLGDFLDAGIDQVVFPLVFGSRPGISPVERFRLGACRPDLATLVGDSSATSVIERSRAWHRDRERISLALRRASGALDLPVEWKATVPAWTCPTSGIRVEPVTSWDALEAEGSSLPDAAGDRGLAHCVATYLERCLRGTCTILSVRALDGRRLSTAELGFGPLRIEQHRGKANGDPPPEAMEALDRMIASLDTGTPSPPASPLLDSALWERLLKSGYDTSRPDLVEMALDLWRPYLAGSVRRMTGAEIVASLPLEDEDWARFQAA